MEPFFLDVKEGDIYKALESTANKLQKKGGIGGGNRGKGV